MFFVFEVFLVVLSNIATVKSYVTVQRSSVVLIGERVELKCSVSGNDVASWKYTSWNSSTETGIYLGKVIISSMTSRYSIEKNVSGQNNLIIDSVDLAYAGRYRCSGVYQSSITDVQLIVLDGPSNVILVEYEDRLECSADGNPTPTYRWTGFDTKRFIEGPVFIMDDKYQAVQCIATNVLGSERKNYTTKNVLHGPRNLIIVEYEDRLECSADGNPTPTYRWTRVDTKSSLEGPVLTWDDNNQIFQCAAINVFGSESKNFTTTKVFDKKSVWDRHAHTIERALLIATLTVFGIVLLIIGLKQRKLSVALNEMLDKSSAKTSSYPPHQSPKIPTSQSPSDEYAEIERADASNNYCPLADQPTAAQKTQVYCELRQIEQ